MELRVRGRVRVMVKGNLRRAEQRQQRVGPGQRAARPARPARRKRRGGGGGIGGGTT